MKNGKKKNWLVITLCVLLACAVLGTVVSGILFSSDPGKTYASAQVEFSFDGAAAGVAPNGYAFTMADMTSDDVLNRALQDAGMADRYTAEQLRQELEVTGVYPENIVEQMTSYESLLNFSANREVMAKVYHPTLYSVVLYNGFDAKISRADLEKLLNSVLTAYRQVFAEKYAVGAQPADLRYDLSQYDYPQRLTLLKSTLQESADYARTLYEKEPTLRKGGVGFNDIAVKLNNLIDTDIDRLNASVTINALTWDKDRLKTQYTYGKDTLEKEYAKRSSQKSNLTDLIASYEQDNEMYMATAAGATKIESNTSETYEQLQKHLETVNNRMITIKSSVQRYVDLLKDLGVKAETSIAPFETLGEGDGSFRPTGTTETPDETGAATTDTGAADTETGAATADEEPATETKVVSQEEYDQYIAELEQGIDELVARRAEIMNAFADLIALYNSQQINDLTVAISAVKYEAPSVFSGAFIKQTLKVAGPFVAVGFMVCLVLLIISRRKEEK